MKTKTTVLLSLGLFVGVLLSPVLSPAQEQTSERFAIWEIVVKPSMVMKFETMLKKEIEMGPPYPWNAYSTDDFHYYFATPIEDYAGIDKLFKMEADWIAKLGEKFQEMIKGFAGTYEYYRFGVYRTLPELSYVPKKPRLKPEETKFIYWGFAYVEVGQEQVFESVFKEWVELYKSKNIAMEFGTAVLEMGGEMPFYFWNTSGKSAAEFYSEDEKATKKIGEEKTMELVNKTFACLRKYEFKTGRPRPDLSVMPKEK